MRAWRRAWIDPTLCRGCATCLEFCPEGAIYLEEGLADLDPAVCDGCGVCARLCPSGAVFMEP
jgi:heterodisulfide reductase subunit A